MLVRSLQHTWESLIARSMSTFGGCLYLPSCRHQANGGSFHPTWTPKAFHQVEWMSILVAGWVDAIVSHDIEEAGQHILRVEVAYVTVEGHSKTFRKLYRFNVPCHPVFKIKQYDQVIQCAMRRINRRSKVVTPKRCSLVTQSLNPEFEPKERLTAWSDRCNKGRLCE